MTIHLIGCTHFGHANIINLANRPFESVEEMDETLIQNWNRQVHPKDTVYHLGDFCWWKSGLGEYLYGQYVDRLNGTLRPIRGNHDGKGWGVHYDELKINKRRIVLCHYPIEEWNDWFKGSVHFHAHTHKPDFVTAERRGNVCVEAIDYTPIALEDALQRLNL